MDETMNRPDVWMRFLRKDAGIAYCDCPNDVPRTRNSRDPRRQRAPSTSLCGGGGLRYSTPVWFKY